MDWIKCITNRLLRAARCEAGITLIETIVAIAIFGIVSTSLIGVLTSATTADARSRQQSIALELAQQQVEYVRQLDYMNVCISGGNPSCPVTTPATVGVAPTLQKRVMGLWYTLKTSIRWVNDAVTTGVATGANYKRVRVTVTRTSDNKQLARVYTFIANPSQTNQSNNAILNVTVLDFGCTIGDGCATSSNPVFVQGAQVDLWDGPSAHASDMTDETGAVTFANLVPNPADTNGVLLPSGATAYYDILASMTGYKTLREDLPPGTVPSGTGAAPTSAGHLQINLSETKTANIRLYRPATINVQVQDASGNPYTGLAYVDIGALYPRCAQEYSTSTGFLTLGPLQASPFDTIGSIETVLCPGGEQPVSGVSYTVGARSSNGALAADAVQKSVPNSYPSDLTSTFIVQLQPVTPKVCTVTVMKGTTKINGARVDVVDGPSGTPPVAQAYATGVTNSSGVAVFSGNNQPWIYLPATGDYDLTVSSASGNGGGTDLVVPNNSPTTGLCNFLVNL